jgi:phage FluMu gp28-like protein
MKAYGLACELLEFDLELDKVKYRAVEVVFPGGSRITALPANPATARGYSANVFLDEFAFHENSREIWKALFPVVSKPGLKLRITSTPNGKGNRFFELWTIKSNRWSKHTVDINQAVADGLERDIDELREAAGDEDLWRQEYLLEFLDEASSWLSYDLITSCEHPDAGKPEKYQGGPCYIGNDIARRKDLWVAWVWELVGDVLWTREISVLRNAKFAEQDVELARLMDFYNVVHVVMDQTGMGEKPVEDAQELYGSDKVHGMHLIGPVRMAVAQSAKQHFEDRHVRIPDGDTELRADLHKIRKVSPETGAPRLIADRDAAGHADRAWANFMGIAGADPNIIEDSMGLFQWLKEQLEKQSGGEEEVEEVEKVAR